MTNYNRYSHHARRALTHAHGLVERMRHPDVDTGHLLVGIMRTDGSTGHRVLQALDLDSSLAEPHLRALYPVLDSPGEDTRNAKSLDMTLNRAANEAAWLAHPTIGTEHLLLGITHTNIGHASLLLRRLGTSSEHLHRRVRRALSEGASESSLQVAKYKLSELSRRVISAAEQRAVAYDHHTVGIGHLLLVMVHETRSPTSGLLRASGLDETQLEAGLVSNDPLLLAALEPVLNQVRDQAARVGSHYTGTEHILLTLLTDAAGGAALAACGVSLADLKQRLETR